MVLDPLAAVTFTLQVISKTCSVTLRAATCPSSLASALSGFFCVELSASLCSKVMVSCTFPAHRWCSTFLCNTTCSQAVPAETKTFNDADPIRQCASFEHTTGVYLVSSLLACKACIVSGCCVGRFHGRHLPIVSRSVFMSDLSNTLKLSRLEG